MSHISQHRLSQSDFAVEYERALGIFHTLRDEYSRRTFSGQKFVITSEITRRLRATAEFPSQRYANALDQLRVAGHHARSVRPPDMRAEHFDNYLSVFYILVELDCLKYVSLFIDQGLNDQSLPIEFDDLKRTINIPAENDFHARFFHEQYRWCPMLFSLNMDGNCSKSNRVIPFCRKEKIEPRLGGFTPSSHISTLWKVEVPEELVAEPLRERVEHSRLQRQVKGAYNEITTVRVSFRAGYVK